MSKRRVVITGLGAVTPIGNNVKDYWENLIAGKSGITRITKFDASEFSVQIAGEVKNFNPADHLEKRELRKIEDFVVYGIVAAREAIKDAGLEDNKYDPNRAGVMVGSGIGGLRAMEEQHKVLLTKGPRRINPFLITRMIVNMAAGYIAIKFGLKGPNTAVSTACATGTHSIGDAFKVIQRGDAELMLAGGSEAAITPLGIAGFACMKALSERNDEPEKASRPFDAQRDGFIMSEGAGVLVLEELEHARKRGARIYAELVGYGMSDDAYHITAPDPEGDGGARAMKAAIDDAGLNPEDIDHINAHGTSTPLNDKLETKGIKTVFGEHAYKIPITANKSMIGHLLGAAGAVEAIATVLSIANDVIPPTINYEFPDPECDLDYVPNTARETKIRAAISNSLGFGGHNCTIAFKKFTG
ncbi:beta-ketoacyl-ACP synthase II [Candidatus Sumerlaeota bacterium]|nr:beta-ketoacyl-ACP synthase II [Candidatus Sumerlaeota bacterium]